MHVLYIIGRLYPFLAIAIVVVLVQVAIHFKRRRDPRAIPYWVVSGILILSAVLWIVFRGDQNSDAWLNAILG